MRLQPSAVGIQSNGNVTGQGDAVNSQGAVTQNLGHLGDTTGPGAVAVVLGARVGLIESAHVERQVCGALASLGADDVARRRKHR